MDTLLNKYRPFFLDDFENANSKTFLFIRHLIKMDRLNIIIIGKETSGKTTLINSIIRDYYKDKSEHYDEQSVLRINILNENGINYYKTDVKTFCQSNINKKKIVVLDDLCSISEEGQLYFKYLIEKYKNIQFIASTTHLHKIVKPILSYFISITIPILTKENITNIIQTIFEKERLVIREGDFLPITTFLIDTTNSNIKMIINIIEKIKLSNLDMITLEKIQILSNNISYISLSDFTNCIINRKLKEAIQIMFHLYKLGFSVVDILYEYFQFIKNQNIIIQDKQKYIIISIITKYITLFYETPETNIELSFFTNELINALERYDLASTHK
jgi:GTPase SAR1 family protein